jgi:hypothetical protein
MSLQYSLQEIRGIVVVYKQGTEANRAGRPIGQAGQLVRQANRAGRPIGQGRLIRQAGQ